MTAAIVCIERFGFAGASVSRIVEEANVSRGAYLHHFRSKHLLYKAVALRLVNDAFRRSGTLPMPQSSDAGDLGAWFRQFWDEVIQGPEGLVLGELVQAARTDELVAQHMRRPAFRAMRLFSWAAARQLPVDKTSPLTSTDIVRLTQWTLRGMALDTALSLDPKFFHRQIDLYVELLMPHLALEMPHDR